MSTLADGASGDLAVDSEGQVWAGGRFVNPEGYQQGVRRWDGTHWALPEAGSAEAPSRTLPSVGTVEADRAGGVWFLEWGDDGRLYRFDGTAWHSRSVAAGMSESLAVGGDGDAWVNSQDSGHTVTRASVDGAMQAFDPEPGLSTYANAIEVTSGGEVLVVTQEGVLRLSGDRFARIWQDYLTPSFGGLVALSKDEVWLGDRFDGDQWLSDGLEAVCGTAVLATDGAVWTRAAGGVAVRHGKGANLRRVVATRTDLDICWDMLAGADGSVWVPDDTELARYSANGARTTIPWPGLTDHECLKAAGPDGSVWVSAETDPGEGVCDDPNAISRWDGRRWTPVDAPRIFGPMMVVTDDGAAWVTGYPGEFIGRYADGRWATFDRDGLSRLIAVPGGRVCGMEQSDPNSSYGDAIVCYDADDEVARIDVQGMGVTSFSVAPDGSIWVLGGQVARLDETLPMG